MAITNYERVGKALELLRDGLRPFVERELQAQHGKYWVTAVTAGWRDELTWREDADAPNLDAALILRILQDQWNETSMALTSMAVMQLVEEGKIDLNAPVTDMCPISN